MKNTKELDALITAIYCINRTNGNEDKDITNLCRYIFLHCTNGNPNMLGSYYVIRTITVITFPCAISVILCAKPSPNSDGKIIYAINTLL